MNHREFDCLVFGFSVGTLAFLWFGYQLRKRVERWHARRSAHHQGRRPGTKPTFATSTRVVLSRDPRVMPIPLAKRDRNTDRTINQHTDFQRIPLHRPLTASPPLGLTEDETKKLVADWHDAWPAATEFQRFDAADHRVAVETGRAIREDAVTALTGAGYKRTIAEAALDACTLAERAGGLESWVAAALRRAQTKG